MNDKKPSAVANQPTPPARPFHRSSSAWCLGVAAVLLIGTLILSHRITAPFTGWHDWNSAWYSYFARNHLRYGLGYTSGLCTHGATREPPEVPHRYLNHPPLIAIWVALPMAVFGEREWACRLVPILSTLSSAWLLMVMVRGLVRPDPPWAGGLLGVLTGLFFLLLPIVAYFGRMIDHVPVVQFFSLLMLHGYLHWTGQYVATTFRPVRGLFLFLAGCVLGIGTGWAAAIMAALIWAWHLMRMLRGRGGWGTLAVLTGVPFLALAAVWTQILWALDWDTSAFVPLFLTRSFGVRPEMPQPVLEWFRILGGFWRLNFTLFGAAAVTCFTLASFVCMSLPGNASLVRRVFRSGRLRMPFVLAAIQGLIYVLAFKNQSWIHEYWQFFLAPTVAFCLASVVWAVALTLARIHLALAVPVTLLLIAAPLAAFGKDYRDSLWTNWRTFHERRHVPDEYIEAFEILNDPANSIEPFAPVMTFRNWSPYEDRFGDYVHRYTQPQIAFHARRPVIFEQDYSAVIANVPGAAAYILELSVPEPHQARIDAMAEQFRARYETMQVQDQLIVFLHRPL